MTTSYVRVAVNVPSLAGVFDYAVPEALAAQVQPGHLVLAPFGDKRVQAVVLEAVDTPAVEKTKEIAALLDPQPVLTAAQVRFATELARETLSPVASIVALCLPPGLAQQADTLFSLAVGGTPLDDLPDLHKRLVKLIQERGPLRGRQIEHSFGQIAWRPAARSLVKRGVLAAQPILPPVRVRPKIIRTAQIAVSPEDAESACARLSKLPAVQARRERALRYLMGHPGPVNVSWVYAESHCTAADLEEMADRLLITLQETEIWRDPIEGMQPQVEGRGEIEFTGEQEAAWQSIRSALHEAGAGRKTQPFLLEGVTGSGKTELYIRAACEASELGRQALILVPEIALTPQTVQRFLERFPGQTGLVHSRLSDGERYDTWRRARLGLLKVIIGPRSALFAPLPSLGLIVLDECHDSSYYQQDPPFYNATSAARLYASVSGAVCIFGSATPSVVQRYQAEVGSFARLQLRQRVGPEAGKRGPAPDLALPKVQVVDMRAELKAGNRGSLSGVLQEELHAALKRGEQAILFLNRRGSATYVFCRTCGWAMKCPRCDSPLTYHVTASERLLCHHCGHKQAMPERCPQCGTPGMRAYGLGTEKLDAEVQKLFPQARTLRWDWETSREKDAHTAILAYFAGGRADVLIGTQMLAKGLDLPRVTLVGMVLADVGLNLPDPFAAERVFQVLTQVAGRAGRRAPGGKAVLQTFMPEHYAIRAAAAQDAEAFYAEEAAQRRRLGYPPFAAVYRLETRDYDDRSAERRAGKLALTLRENARTRGRKAVTVTGPAPCFYSRVDGQYRWQVVLRGAGIRELLPALGPEWRIEVEPVSLL